MAWVVLLNDAVGCNVHACDDRVIADQRCPELLEVV